jgi:ribosomal protein S18 acetylase RimI-like enzyme
VSVATNIHYTIRSFRPGDAEACRVLYREGLLGGQLAENDTGLDIDDIEMAYMRPGSHFWVAESPEGEVVGMIGVQKGEDSVGEIRRLRVAVPHRRRGIARQLLDAAVKFCRDNAYLKVALDTFTDREPAIKLFETAGFKHSRSKNIGGKDLHYFYLDLCHGEPRKSV